MFDVIARIEELRKGRRWTKYKLAEEAMLTYSTLSSMYARNTPPKMDVLEMICNAFEMSLSRFFLDENGENEIVTETEKELLKNFRTLPEDKKKAVLSLIKTNA